jgi:uncharacterized membrane protein YphA (DoxX/SURF4 family)
MVFDRNTLIYCALRWGLGTVFIWAGAVKLVDPATFSVLMEAYGIVPQALLMPMAVLLPALEVAAGIGLLFDIEGSLAAITLMLGLFIIILGYGIWLGLDIDCGCFGPNDPEARAFHGLRLSLYRDLILLAGAAAIYGWRRCYRISPRAITTIYPGRRSENAPI